MQKIKQTLLQIFYFYFPKEENDLGVVVNLILLPLKLCYTLLAGCILIALSPLMLIVFIFDLIGKLFLKLVNKE